MDKKKILKYSGKVFLGEKIEKAAFEYIFDNPEVTAEDLAGVSLVGKNIKICSPTVAQKYIDIVLEESR